MIENQIQDRGCHFDVCGYFALDFQRKYAHWRKNTAFCLLQSSKLCKNTKVVR